MKKILLLTAVVCTFAGTLIAQNTQHKQQRKTRAQAQQNSNSRAQAATDRLTRELQLSTEQRQKVYQLVLESQKQPLRTKEQMAKYNAELDQILTAEQKASMQRLKSEKTQADRMSQMRQSNLQSAPGKPAAPGNQKI